MFAIVPIAALLVSLWVLRTRGRHVAARVRKPLRIVLLVTGVPSLLCGLILLALAFVEFTSAGGSTFGVTLKLYYGVALTVAGGVPVLTYLLLRSAHGASDID